MAKFGKVSEETQEMVDNIINEVGLVRVMDIKVASVPKGKKVIDVKRLQPLGEYVAKKCDVVCIIVYEKAFDRLEARQREILMRDAINLINYDSEKDKITIGCPQIVVSCGGRAKWGDELVNAAETAVMAIQQVADEEKAEKESRKSKKKDE